MTMQFEVFTDGSMTLLAPRGYTKQELIEAKKAIGLALANRNSNDA